MPLRKKQSELSPQKRQAILAALLVGSEIAEQGDAAIIKKLAEMMVKVDEFDQQLTDFTASFTKEYGELSTDLRNNLVSDVKAIQESVQTAKSEIEQTLAALRTDHESVVSGLSKSTGQALSNLTKDLIDIRAELSAVRGSIPVFPEIPEVPDYTELHQSISERLERLDTLLTGENVRNALEALPEGDKLALEAIEGLRKELDDLRVVRSQPGAGVTDMRIRQAFKYILHTEQPSGLINGVNTTYTVSQTIFAVLAFSLNGEVIAELPNYTVAGKTITFATALPAAFSGKDFEIKYIG